MKLYSAWYCPFAQRVWMSLLYKQVEFEYIEVDPYIETPKWLELSKGTAQVPVFVVGKENIVDSTKIMSQLDKIFPKSPPLFSIDSNKKTKQLMCIDHINNKIVPFFYHYLKANIEGEQKDKAEQNLLYSLSIFSEVLDRAGPYFSGENISAVDFSLFPFAHRIQILLGYYRDFHLPISVGGWRKYHQWYEQMLRLPEFKETSIIHSNYEQRLIDVYYPYSQGGGQEIVTDTLYDSIISK